MYKNRELTLFTEALEKTQYDIIYRDGITGNKLLQIVRRYKGTYDIIKNSSEIEGFTFENELRQLVNQEYATRRKQNGRIRQENIDANNLISIVKRLIREDRFKKILDK
ncbi:MAG: hypothetical protein SLAVMIC_00853 [uncultured marine phage]|uniref:Uncharacterized protein n=1 Tax=uncultured marine phage TaxID=707152 RepID=A0A8D9FQK7_9VIRU|nr:MAG: hypothetical protein SLAVMIC_00853 [uncultured marine phage]